MKRYSIIMELNKCLVCNAKHELHIHEVFFGTSKRKLSIEDGMCVTLCPFHHNASIQGVHLNRQLDLQIKRKAQKIWMKYYNKNEEDFIKRYGKSYLEDYD